MRNKVYGVIVTNGLSPDDHVGRALIFGVLGHRCVMTTIDFVMVCDALLDAIIRRALQIGREIH